MKGKLLIWAQIIAGATLLGLVVGSFMDNLLQNKEKAKYIFLFIGDGMGESHVGMTESYLSFKNGKKGGEQLTFTRFPNLAMSTTYSANREITCSAAAGTAIACGEKTNNSYLGVDPEGKPIESVAVELKNKGYNIGIISSVPINHATPSAFYAHSTSRYAYYPIMKSIPESGFEFMAGAGFINYFGNNDKETGSEEYLESQGYTVCFGMEEYDNDGRGKEKVILCQEYNKGKNAADYIAGEKKPENEISLSTMLDCCLENLGEKEPFFIMCEGGAIDWAAHMNKTMPMISMIMEFDEAIAKAYDFYLKHPEETLIIVTADHATGGPTMGFGREWKDDRVDWRILDSAWTAAGECNTSGYEENQVLNQKAFIGWTSSNHTGENVPVYAIGKGSDCFKGRMDNTEFKVKILAE